MCFLELPVVFEELLEGTELQYTIALFTLYSGFGAYAEMGTERDQQLRLPDAIEHHRRENVQRPQSIPGREYYFWGHERPVTHT